MTATTPLDDKRRKGTQVRLPWRTKPASLVTGYGQDLRVIRSPFMWFWAIVGLAVALTLPAFVPTFYVHLVNLALIAVIGAVALNLLTGNAGLISLGHAAFLATGGFTAAGLVHFYDAPLVITVPAAAIAGGILGGLVGLPSLRLRGLYLAVTTLALHFAVVLLVTAFQSQAVQSAGIVMPAPSIGPMRLGSRTAWYYLLLVLAIATVVVAANLLRSRMGRAWTAIHDRDIAAEALGVGLTRAKLAVFVFTSAVTAGAGALAGYYAKVVTAEAYTLELAIAYLAMIIIGGMGSVLGSVLGAMFVTWLPYGVEQVLRVVGIEVGAGRISGVQTAVFAVLIILFLLFEPDGLVEIWRRLRNYLSLWPFRFLPLQQRER